MKEQLKQYIADKMGRTPPRIGEVLNCFEEKETRRKEVLLEVGKVCHHCYFIVEGCLQVSTCDLNGEESTISLSFENEWRTAMRSFLNQQPSNERIVCAEPCQLLVISREKFLHLSEQIPQFEQLYKGLLEESYTASIDRIQALMALDAKSRVQWLLSQQPRIFTRLSNRLIASYLGLSESTLSRLKTSL